jgi:hypothetical protein
VEREESGNKRESGKKREWKEMRVERKESGKK